METPENNNNIYAHMHVGGNYIALTYLDSIVPHRSHYLCRCPQWTGLHHLLAQFSTGKHKQTQGKHSMKVVAGHSCVCGSVKF